MVSKEQILAHVRGRHLKPLVEALIDKKYWIVSERKESLEKSLKGIEERLKKAGIRVKFMRRGTFYFFFVCDEPWITMFEELEKKNREIDELCRNFDRWCGGDYKRWVNFYEVDEALRRLNYDIKTALNDIADDYRYWVENKDKREIALQAAERRFNSAMEHWRRVVIDKRLHLLFL